jgi:AcrR family transcriptional regulator
MAPRVVDRPSLLDTSLPSPPTVRRAWGKIPYEQRYRQQRHNLLQAAEDLGAEHGIGNTTISDIVREAGVSKRVFYEHFADKEACYVELARGLSVQYIRSAAEAARTAVGLDHHAAVVVTLKGLSKRHADPRLIAALRSEAPAGSALAQAWDDHADAVAETLVALARSLGSRHPDKNIRLAARLVVRGVFSLQPAERHSIDELAEVCCLALGLPA